MSRIPFSRFVFSHSLFSHVLFVSVLSIQVLLLALVPGICFGLDSESNIIEQERVRQESSWLFPNDPKVETKIESDEDVRFLAQTLREFCMYGRSAYTHIKAKGESKKFPMLKKYADFLYVTEQNWSSYILFNDHGKILEFRQFFPSAILSAESKVGFEIKFVSRFGDRLAEWGRELGQSSSLVKSSVGRIMETTGMAARQEYEGDEAKRILADEAGNYSGVLEQTLFSNTSYLVFYDLGNSVPDKVVRVVLEGNTFKEWEAVAFSDERSRDEESIRKGTILRGAYIVDKAILPEGKPARKGDKWMIPADVFGEVMGLRTNVRLQTTSGRVSLKRDDYDATRNGEKLAVLSLGGNHTANQIVLKTYPKRLDDGAQETIEAVFMPTYGKLYWNFSQKQITSVELWGKAELQQSVGVDWGFDKTVVMTPDFHSIYESAIVEEDFLQIEKNRRMVQSLVEIVEKSIDPEIAAKMRRKIETK